MMATIAVAVGVLGAYSTEICTQQPPPINALAVPAAAAVPVAAFAPVSASIRNSAPEVAAPASDDCLPVVSRDSTISSLASLRHSRQPQRHCALGWPQE